MAQKFYMAERVDSQPRIIILDNVRFDLGGNVLTEEETAILKKNRDFKKMDGTFLKISEINITNEKSITKAIDLCESKPAKDKAKKLFEQFLEDLNEKKDSK